jgi:hypothetical protein
MKDQKARRSLLFAVAALHESPYDWSALALWRSELRFASSHFTHQTANWRLNPLNHEQS